MEILYQNLLSFLKPYNPVSPRTLARWIMSVLQSSGIDASILETHSVRWAASSHAYVTGTPVTDWSSERVFRKLYLRDIEKEV